MIDLEYLSTLVGDADKPGFEGHWHAIELQPDLAVPQRFVIGVALSRNGKLDTYRLAEEAPRLKCFYEKRFSLDVWRFLRSELDSELKLHRGKPTKRYQSSSPQVSLGNGHFVSGISTDSALNRTFERIVTVVGKDRKPRATGINQAELRAAVGRWLKSSMSTRYEEIAQPEGGILIRHQDVLHQFDIGLDDHRTASSVISGCNAGMELSKLNVLTAWNDLNAFAKIRERDQIGIAVLQPTTQNIPAETVKAWSAWWADFTYKLKESSHVLLAEDTTPEGLALQVSHWYS